MRSVGRVRDEEGKVFDQMSKILENVAPVCSGGRCFGCTHYQRGEVGTELKGNELGPCGVVVDAGDGQA